MSWKKYLGLVTSTTLVGVVAMANGCSSSSSNAGASDSGTGSDAVVHHEGGSSSGSSSGGGDDSGAEGGGTVADGTTGKACTSDADCASTNSAAPGLVKCSLTMFQAGAIFPSGVCLMGPTATGNCATPNDGAVHYCDGPDDPSSPGICYPIGSGASTGNCYPQCTFKTDNSAPTGCVGKNACSPYGFGPDTNGTSAVGVGICYGGCEADADCPTGNKCQTNLGLCLTMLTTQQAEGSGCTQSAKPSDACNCLSSTGSAGFCGVACKTGGSVPCAAGEVCDAFLPTTVTGAGDAALTGWTTENPGLAGYCFPKCTVDGGAQTEAGTCFTNSTCTAGTAVGPDCQ